jgi:signal transduction histidine kinase
LEEKVSERTHELQKKYTEIVMLNHELEKLNQEKNEFLDMAAHDLKNPLSAILGLSDMIKSDYDTMPSEEVIEAPEIISKASRQMFELITTFLDVNAIESGKLNLSLNQIDILPILQTLVENYEDRADAKNLTLHFQPVATSYTAWVDKNICRQILDNLLSNAIKYSLYGNNIFIRINQQGQSICCEIQDEGPGLSEPDKQKLFCKFNRLTAKPTGKEHSTGLGLFIVKKLVEAMNGKVWCESELGRGATFVVELPSG